MKYWVFLWCFALSVDCMYVIMMTRLMMVDSRKSTAVNCCIWKRRIINDSRLLVQCSTYKKCLLKNIINKNKSQQSKTTSLPWQLEYIMSKNKVVVMRKKFILSKLYCAVADKSFRTPSFVERNFINFIQLCFQFFVVVKMHFSLQNEKNLV